jgi:hypothetical protein
MTWHQPHMHYAEDYADAQQSLSSQLYAMWPILYVDTTM